MSTLAFPMPHRTAARTAAAARIVLGLVFLAAGLSGFVLVFSNAPLPPQPGLAGQFQEIFFKTHWVLAVDGIEAIAGALLLVNRYVPLGLTLYAAVLYNIFAFHLSMAPSTLFVPVILALLWLFVASGYRDAFDSLLKK